MSHKTKLLLLITMICFSFRESHAQKQQLWFDYVMNYPFANSYVFSATGTYQTVLSRENKWRAFGIEPTLEHSYFTNLDLVVTVPMTYTLQTENYNSVNIDPALYARFHVSQNKRVNVRFIFRYDFRALRNLEEKSWQTGNRMRLKGEAIVSINHPNMFHDKLWYSSFDYEEFFVVDQQLDERFANRRRVRWGIGYRLDYKHRFELLYTLQSSRNQIDDEFTSIDNVMQLKYKLFLNPAKPQSSNP